MDPKITDNIVFRETKTKEHTIITAQLLVESHQFISNLALEACNYDLKTEAKRFAQERLLRVIYSDQRNKFYKAIMDLRTCQPFDYGAQSDAIDKIMELAARSYPTEI